MTNSESIVNETRYSEMPSVGLAMLKALVLRRAVGSIEGKENSELIGIIEGFEPDLKKVDMYKESVEHSTIDTLPATYPFAMAFPVVLDLMTSKKFPLKVLGLIHVKQEINQIMPIPDNLPLNLKCRIKPAQKVSRGVEFEVSIEVFCGDHLHWQGTSIFLSKAKSEKRGSDKKISSKESKASDAATKTFPKYLGSDLGKKFAQASDDYNPIHIAPWMAKFFGLPGHIAHGMWTMGWVAGSLIKDRSSFRFSMRFRSPIYLPNNISLRVNEPDKGDSKYEVMSSNQTILFAEGEISKADKTESKFEVEEAQDEYTPAPTTLHEQELFG